MGTGVKKAAIVWLVVALLLGASIGVGAREKVADVPKDHWAYEAVVRLVEEGYLGLYEDGTFQGGKPVDRYTLASVVAKILDQVVSGGAKVTQDDVALLRQLTTEFRDELVQWYREKDELKARVDELDKASEAVKQQVYESVDQLTAADAQLMEEIKALRNSLQSSEANAAAVFSSLQARDQELVEAIKEVGGKVAAADGKVTAVGEKVAVVEEKVAAVDAKVDTVDIMVSELGQKVDMVDSVLTEVSGEVTGLESAVAEHSRLLDQAKAEIQANKEGLSKHSVQLAAQADAIAALEDILDVNVENRFQEREAALTMVKDELAEADAKLRAALESNQTDLAGLKDKVAALENRLQTSISAQAEGLDGLQKDLDQAQKTLVDLREELAKGQEANDTRFADQESRIAAMEDRIGGYQARLGELKSELDLLRQRFMTLEDTVVRIGKVVTTLDEELGRDLDTNISMALQRYRVLEQDVAALKEELRQQKARSLEEIEQMKRTNSFLMLGGGLAIILLFVLGQ